MSTKHTRTPAAALLSAFSFLILALAGFSGLSAQDYPRFRADDVPSDRLVDNPALLGLNDQDWAMGFNLGLGNQGLPGILSGTVLPEADYTFYTYTNFLNYRLHRATDGTIDHQTGISLGFGDSFALGYRHNWREDGTILDNALGFIFRPLDFLSVGITVDHLAQSSMQTGFGLALRPLFFLKDAVNYLTLTADAHVDYTGNFAMESVGASLSLAGFELRGWYDLEHQTPGAEILWRLDGLETGLRMTDLAGLGGASLGMAARGGEARTPPLLLSGGSLLVIDDIDSLATSPQVQGWLESLLGQGMDPDLVQAVEALEKAATDPAIKAVVVKKVPAFDTLSSALRFSSALAGVRKAGKPVHAWLDETSATNWIAALGASSISLHPATGIDVVSPGSQTPFLKSFLAQFGVRVINLGIADTKSANNLLTMDAMPEAERDMHLRWLKTQGQLELKAVGEGRGKALRIPADQVLARGPWLSAKSALDDGLVDALEFADQFDARLKKELGENTPEIDFESYIRTSHSPRTWGPSVMSTRIAVVYLNGNIADGEEQAGKGIGSLAVKTLTELKDNPWIKGVILRVNSGGGTIKTSADLDRAVRLLKESGKKVAVSMADVAASGGYYLASHADRIFAEESTLTGSIGVTGILLDLDQTLKLLKINMETLDTAPNSHFASPFGSSPEDEKRVKEWIKTAYDDFLAVVSDGRGIPVETLEPLARGQTWPAAEALQYKLVDQIGGLKEAKAWMAETLGTAWPEYIQVVPGTTSDDLASGIPSAGLAGSGFSLKAPDLLASLLGRGQVPVPAALGVSAVSPGSAFRKAINTAIENFARTRASSSPRLDGLIESISHELDRVLSLQGQVLYQAD